LFKFGGCIVIDVCRLMFHTHTSPPVPVCAVARVMMIEAV
jgi:hypothetical protein